MCKEYLSFECWCVEVADIIYYNYIADEDRESIIEEYILYCEENNLEHDYE